jgi:hypothetical protein
MKFSFFFEYCDGSGRGDRVVITDEGTLELFHYEAMKNGSDLVRSRNISDWLIKMSVRLGAIFSEFIESEEMTRGELYFNELVLKLLIPSRNEQERYFNKRRRRIHHDSRPYQ